MRTSVTLHTQKSVKGDKEYTYWVIRWFGANGRRRGQQIGRVDEISRRQAEKRRKAKEAELEAHPGRRDVDRSPTLGSFLEQYYADRRTELATGTLDLHRLTGRYLLAFFGSQRRLDAIGRAEATAFKTALADGQLTQDNKRVHKKPMAVTTVDQHMRQSKTMFNHALANDLVTFNPFDRIAQSSPVEMDWHYVDAEEFAKLMAAAKPGWKLLLALARWAGLRLEEALELPWKKLDLQKGRLTIISRAESDEDGEFTVKDKDSRVVPICLELAAVLKEVVPQGQSGTVVPRDSVVRKNVWRDFQVLARKAGVTSYPKPLHSLRKSCITDWAGRFPAHVVKEWAGHADIRTTLKYYLKVPEAEYDRAARLSMVEGVTQPSKKAQEGEPSESPDAA